MTERKRKKVTNANKATAVGGALGVATSVASSILGAKMVRYGVPIEQGVAIAGGAVGFLFAVVGRWASKLLPNE